MEYRKLLVFKRKCIKRRYSFPSYDLDHFISEHYKMIERTPQTLFLEPFPNSRHPKKVPGIVQKYFLTLW